MINKNKFSIKDTKKVLHKVGKRWVVVSAVLLGLAAGGAAVTTANADTTAHAAQPTVAQQVNKNANVSVANHSFGAADPANATKAPASSATMKLGAADGVNGLVNNAKSTIKTKLANHQLPSTVSGMKAYAKSAASSADVNHLTDLANLARVNGQQNSYADLVNLANNDNDRFNNIKVGSDTASNSDADTLFGVLNRAHTDVSAINSGRYSNSTVSKISDYLSGAQSLANSTVSSTFDASQLNDFLNMVGVSSLPTSVTMSSSNMNVLGNPMPIPSTTVSVTPSFTLNLNIPSVINSGINVSSAVSSAVNGSDGIVTTASNSIQSQASNIASGLADKLDAAEYITNPLERTAVKSKLNEVITTNASKAFAREIHGSALASKIISNLYGMGIGTNNGLFGPFTNKAVSPSAASSTLTDKANAIDLLLSKFNVPNASVEVNGVVNLLNKASEGLEEFDASPANGYYNNLVSTAANLTNTDTNYPSASSAYGAIASDASNLNRELTKASVMANAMHFNIPKYSDVSGYVSTEIMSEANSSVNSMNSTSASMTNTLNEAKADNTNSLENTLLSGVIAKLSKASTNYNNSLTDQDTSEALDNEAINFMSDNSKVGTTNVVGTPNETFNAQSLTAPANYSLASDATDNATITINNSSANVDVNQTGNSNNNMPFVPSFNSDSSATSESMNNSARASISAEPEPSMASGNSYSAESKARYANYVLITKALQLHTRANFTKKNGVAVIKPGVVLNVEKTVRARHGLVRYEVRYNNKNYFVTANKHFGVYDSYELAKPSYYRYAKVDKALQLHQSTNFTKKNGVKVVKPGMEFRINRVVKSSKGAIRYEVNYKGSVYFITANAHYVENAYLQKSNFKRGRKMVRVIKPFNEYRRTNFTKRNLVRSLRCGVKLHVSRVRTIASGEMTRLQLTNGHYVTANKNFVKVIK